MKELALTLHSIIIKEINKIVQLPKDNVIIKQQTKKTRVSLTKNEAMQFKRLYLGKVKEMTKYSVVKENKIPFKRKKAVKQTIKKKQHISKRTS